MTFNQVVEDVVIGLELIEMFDKLDAAVEDNLLEC